MLGIRSILLIVMIGLLGCTQQKKGKTSISKKSLSHGAEESKEHVVANSVDRPAVKSNNPNSKQTQTQTIVSGANAFGLSHYKMILQQENAGKNLVYSPFSAWVLMSMLKAGARGETEKQLNGVIRAGSDRRDFFKSCGELLTQINKVPAKSSLRLLLANGIFRQTGFPILQEFRDTLKSDFGTAPVDVNFEKNPEKARSIINEWVKSQTDGKIPSLLSDNELPPNLYLFLINVVRLKDMWKESFTNLVDGQNFYGIGVTKKVRMINSAGHHAYADLGDFRAAAINTRSGLIDMIILLPSKKDGLAALERSLGTDVLTKTFDGLKARSVDFTLPSFKVDNNHNLVESLRHLGIESMFSRDANFRGIDGGKGAIRSTATTIKQNALIDVSKDGLEAVAATAGGPGGVGAPQITENSVRFFVNHPFLYLVRHKPTNSVLFMGRIVNL